MSFLKLITKFERRDLLIAWLALSCAFTLVFSRLRIGADIGNISVQLILINLAVALIVVAVSFIFHEMAHKYTAIHFGYWAEFRKSTPMLLVSLAIAVITGFVFAAPGATLINTAGREMTKKENGIISVAGPVSNLILSIPFIILMIAGIITGGATAAVASTGFIWSLTPQGFCFYLGYTGLMVNAMLALFNMIPAGPLDGKKILKWNPIAFAVVLILAILIVALSINPQSLFGLFA
ncbi:MAG TPA: peptidase M50 [Methanocorpusculum sp.]|nr:peptidase M50 [Methanocorpusculum sp.]